MGNASDLEGRHILQHGARPAEEGWLEWHRRTRHATKADLLASCSVDPTLTRDCSVARLAAWSHWGLRRRWEDSRAQFIGVDRWPWLGESGLERATGRFAEAAGGDQTGAATPMPGGMQRPGRKAGATFFVLSTISLWTSFAGESSSAARD